MDTQSSNENALPPSGTSEFTWVCTCGEVNIKAVDRCRVCEERRPGALQLSNDQHLTSQPVTPTNATPLRQENEATSVTQKIGIFLLVITLCLGAYLMLQPIQGEGDLAEHTVHAFLFWLWLLNSIILIAIPPTQTRPETTSDEMLDDAGDAQIGSTTPDREIAGVLPVVTEFAGFWFRLAATIIDFSIFVTILVIVADIYINASIATDAAVASEVAIITVQIMFVILFLLYFMLLDSSPAQGTLGKLAFRIKVTDLDGKRISFRHAALRTVSKFLSAFLFIGFIIAGFTEKKQALHDMLTNCLVVKII